MFEHVEDLECILDQQARILKAGGEAMHCFPGKRNIWEHHLQMPFVHWLPKNRVRRHWISTMMALGLGPAKNSWPKLFDAPKSQRVETYFNYLNQQTFYRSTSQLKQQAEQRGFQASFKIIGVPSTILRYFSLIRDGFPLGWIVLHLKKTT